MTMQIKATHERTTKSADRELQPRKMWPRTTAAHAKSSDNVVPIRLVQESGELCDSWFIGSIEPARSVSASCRDRPESKTRFGRQ